MYFGLPGFLAFGLKDGALQSVSCEESQVLPGRGGWLCMIERHNVSELAYAVLCLVVGVFAAVLLTVVVLTIVVLGVDGVGIALFYATRKDANGRQQMVERQEQGEAAVKAKAALEDQRRDSGRVSSRQCWKLG